MKWHKLNIADKRYAKKTVSVSILTKEQTSLGAEYSLPAKERRHKVLISRFCHYHGLNYFFPHQ